VLLNILESFQTNERQGFLQFCTATSRMLPNQGLSIAVIPRDSSFTQPFGRTCVHRLELPDYYAHAVNPYFFAWDSLEESAPQEAWEMARDAAREAFPDMAFPTQRPPAADADEAAWEHWMLGETQHPDAHPSARHCSDVNSLRAIFSGHNAALDSLGALTSTLPRTSSNLERTSSEKRMERVAKLQTTPRFRYACALARFCFLSAFQEMRAGGFVEK